MAKVRRQTVDLTGHPDLVVVYLGMQVKTLLGLKTVASFGPKIRHAVEAEPDGCCSIAGDGHPPCGHRSPRPNDLDPVPSRGLPSAPHRLQDVPPKSTSLASTVPAVRPGAVW
jgi:hypothetical protein